MLKRLIRRAAEAAGVHLSPMTLHPEQTLVGLARKPIDLIIDVGANEGQFARDMRKVFPRAHIVSFEPTPQAFAALDRLARSDGNLTAVNCALGEEAGTQAIHFHLDHSPSSSLLETTELNVASFPQTARQTQVTVPVRKLDDVVSELALKPGPNTLLKLDTQGFEEYVLKGGTETLTRVGACILEVCLDRLYVGQAAFASLVRLCDAGGLVYRGNISQVYAPDGHVIYIDAVFARRNTADG